MGARGGRCPDRMLRTEYTPAPGEWPWGQGLAYVSSAMRRGQPTSRWSTCGRPSGNGQRWADAKRPSSSAAAVLSSALFCRARMVREARARSAVGEPCPVSCGPSWVRRVIGPVVRVHRRSHRLGALVADRRESVSGGRPAEPGPRRNRMPTRQREHLRRLGSRQEVGFSREPVAGLHKDRPRKPYRDWTTP
jgi:hypothetical protein